MIVLILATIQLAPEWKNLISPYNKGTSPPTPNVDKPKMESSITAVIWGPIREKEPGAGSAITLDVQVVNRGVPSIAFLKGVYLITADGRRVDGKLFSIALKNQVIAGREGIPDIILNADEQLIPRISQVIPSDGMAHGWVRYAFEGVSFREIGTGKSKITVDMEDINHNPFSGAIEIKSVRDAGNMYMPLNKHAAGRQISNEKSDPCAMGRMHISDSEAVRGDIGFDIHGPCIDIDHSRAVDSKTGFKINGPDSKQPDRKK